MLFCKTDNDNNPEDATKVCPHVNISHWGQMYYKDYPAIKSPELEAVIVEQILVVCVNRTRFNELFDTIRKITSFSHYILKKYLFHLIEYGIISYKGETQVYVITRTGLELLSIMNREKRTTQLDFKDIVICLE